MVDVVPPLLHWYEKGGVPPVGFAVAEPSAHVGQLTPTAVTVTEILLQFTPVTVIVSQKVLLQVPKLSLIQRQTTYGPGTLYT
jgi:hypothetical protein